MILKYTIAWLGLTVLAILNGLLREKIYRNSLGELRAHQISTLIFVILISIYTWTLNQFWEISSVTQAWAIGFTWLFLTLSFEFLFGHYVMKHPWEKLFHDYNLLEGRIWIIVLIGVMIIPCIIYQTNH